MYNIARAHVLRVVATGPLHGKISPQKLLWKKYMIECHNCQYFYLNWLYIWVAWRVSYKKQEMFTLSELLGSPSVLDEVRVAHLLTFLCCVLFVCVCVHLWTVCPMFPVSLGCPFLIVPLVFPNFYLLTNKRCQIDTCVVITVVVGLKKWICYGNIFCFIKCLNSSSVLFLLCCRTRFRPSKYRLHGYIEKTIHMLVGFVLLDL